jgi:hypothetical protein
MISDDQNHIEADEDVDVENIDGLGPFEAVVLPADVREAIASIVGYLWVDEAKDFLSWVEEGQENGPHIFESVRLSAAWLAAQ